MSTVPYKVINQSENGVYIAFAYVQPNGTINIPSAPVGNTFYAVDTKGALLDTHTVSATKEVILPSWFHAEFQNMTGADVKIRASSSGQPIPLGAGDKTTLVHPKDTQYTVYDSNNTVQLLIYDKIERITLQEVILDDEKESYEIYGKVSTHFVNNTGARVRVTWDGGNRKDINNLESAQVTSSPKARYTAQDARNGTSYMFVDSANQVSIDVTVSESGKSFRIVKEQTYSVGLVNRSSEIMTFALASGAVLTTANPNERRNIDVLGGSVIIPSVPSGNVVYPAKTEKITEAQTVTFDTSGLNLSPEEYNIIKGWFPNRTFKRIYSSRDDHRSGHVEDFKRQVGGFATTLVIITATNGLKFGGYLHPAWGFTGNYIYDTSNPIQSFIFSLKPFTGQAQRYYVHSTGHVAAFGQSSYGVDFGPDDLYVNNALVVTHSNTGHIATRGNEFIGGGSSIQASLIEAYHVSY